MKKTRWIVSALLALILVSPVFSQTTQRIRRTTTITSYPPTTTTTTTTTTSLVTNTEAPLISSVTYDINRRYAAGDTLTVTLRGEPGGQATFDVGALSTGIPMTEVSPGVYVGNYTLPQNITESNIQIVGHLYKGTSFDFQISPYMLSMLTTGKAVVDELHPQNGSYVTTDPPYALVKFWNDVTYKTQKNMSAYLDGKDITQFSTITPNSLAYSSPKPFALGKHLIRVESEDEIGNKFEQNLAFDIASQPIAQFTSVPAQSLLTSVKIFDNVTSPVKNGDIVTVTMLGRPNGQANFDVASGPTTTVAYSPVPTLYTPAIYAMNQTTYTNQVATTNTTMQTTTQTSTLPATSSTTTTTTYTPTYVSGAPVYQPYQPTGMDSLSNQMREISPGTYVGTYVISNSDFFNHAVLTGHLALPDGNQLVGFAPALTDFSVYAAQMILPNQTVAATTTTSVSGAPATTPSTTTNY